MHQNTEVGSVFVSNYPPYSFWNEGDVECFHEVLDQPPREGAPLGLYMHIPFCRKRCKFCYFRVYIGRNAQEVSRYVDAVIEEARLYRDRAAISGRPVDFVYFGGGTPSFISVKHLRRLVDGVQAYLPWDQVREIAFECEPGTLSRSKLEAIKDIGVTRLSLGVEHFDDKILESNGRAHVSKEIYRVLPWIHEIGFKQLNIDLIVGLIGDTFEGWQATVEEAIRADPDSVTIYQLELPFNTTYSKGLLSGEQTLEVADWATKRHWHLWAFRRFEEAGYEISSAYTVVKKGTANAFVYRDALWEGADLLSLGVSSFGHLSGVHYQNESSWTPYLERVEKADLPVLRAYSTEPDERLIRELILQLKRGRLALPRFEEKFGVDVEERFGDAFRSLEEEGWLSLDDRIAQLSPEGLLRVDHFLPRFYQPQHRNARYT
ncbi:MAG: coproporphyrinogen-III oxidase family protein [Acidobacteriota bacterium]